MTNYEKIIRPQSAVRAKITSLEALEKVIHVIDQYISEDETDIKDRTYKYIYDLDGNHKLDGDGDWATEPMTFSELHTKYKDDLWELQHLEDSYYEKLAFEEIKKQLTKNI